VLGLIECHGQNSGRKVFCFCWVRFQGHFGSHLQIPKEQCLSAVQGAISLDRFISSMEAIEILCKDTDNIGVTDEIGGCQVYGKCSSRHQRFHSKSMQLFDLNKNECSKPGLLALSELLINLWWRMVLDKNNTDEYVNKSH
jgi:hypothetical protein